MRLLTVALFGLVAACAAPNHDGAPFMAALPAAMPIYTPAEALAAGLPRLAPETAVMTAAGRPDGLAGVFAMPVRRVENVGPRLFLNSEADYRDQRSLGVAIQPSALPGLRSRLGAAPARAFSGKNVRVFGLARRVRIDFVVNGRPTGKYYYQTHVDVIDARQIDVAS